MRLSAVCACLLVVGLALVASASPDAGVVAPPPDITGDTSNVIQWLFRVLATGQGWMIAGGVLVGIVHVLRKYVLRGWTWAAETKLGGWVVAYATALILGFAHAMLAGQPITFTFVAKIFASGFEATTLWEALHDVRDWVRGRVGATPPVPPAQT